LNEASINSIIKSLSNKAYKSILDVGSGNGYLLNCISKINNWNVMAGVDVAPTKKTDSPAIFYKGVLPNLPFENDAFDVVTCTHVIEHVIDVSASIKELIRVARKKIIVVVPRQRYYYYTLDEHLNFFPQIDPLIKLFAPYPVEVSLESGDWVLEISINKPSGVLNEN
jgi:ubiquinone/menaquinone biosynthesis C-methylase UbiE